jgi:hypothetical protein
MTCRALCAVAIAGVAVAGCSSGSHQASSTPTTTITTISSGSSSEAMLKEAARAALNENSRLSLYVLWNNRVPSWAEHSTRGPALVALRNAAATRKRQGIRIRSQPGRYLVLSVQLDPSYTRAIAVVRDRRRVFPYRAGKRIGRAIAVDDRARVELKRLGSQTRFVVWRVRPIR